MASVSSVSRSTTSAASAASTKLVVGASGAQVKELQQLLKSLGLYPYNCDGNFGPKTEAAVKAFQRSHGLTADGWAGPQTMAKLRAAAAPKPPATAPAASGLKVGSSGDAVKEVQLRLKALGLYNGAIGGNFGPGTEAAVKAFQKMKGLAQTGVVDQTTLDKLRGGAAPAPAVSIGRGATGNSVKKVQMILTALGFYKSGVDGSFGPVTEGAVKAFQGQQGLPQTGVVNQTTLDTLRAANAARGNTPPVSTPVSGTLQPGAPVTPPSLPANGTTTPVQPPGLSPVPANASRDQKLQAVLNYGIYWANAEKQNPGATTYVGGASAYRFGGVGTNGSAQQSGQSRYRSTAGVVGFDCSGLVHTMFAQAGLNVPSNSRDLAKAGQPVSFNDLQPGDILSKAGSHVVVYIGNGQVVEATPFNKVQVGTSNGVPVYEGGGVRISSVSNFTEANGYVARRVL